MYNVWLELSQLTLLSCNRSRELPLVSPLVPHVRLRAGSTFFSGSKNSHTSLLGRVSSISVICSRQELRSTYIYKSVSSSNSNNSKKDSNKTSNSMSITFDWPLINTLLFFPPLSLSLPPHFHRLVHHGGKWFLYLVAIRSKKEKKAKMQPKKFCPATGFWVKSLSFIIH